MGDKERRVRGRTLVLAAATIVFGGFAVSYVIYTNLNPPANLYVEIRADCVQNATACDALAYTALDDGSVSNLTLLSRALDAFDHPENYSRADRSGDNLTYRTSTAAARELLGFLRTRLEAEHPELVVGGGYTGDILLRYHDRVYALSMRRA